MKKVKVFSVLIEIQAPLPVFSWSPALVCTLGVGSSAFCLSAF